MKNLDFKRHSVEGCSYYVCPNIEYGVGVNCIVFIHGEGSDHNFWDKIPEGLVHMGFSPICIDLPGHGKSREKGFTVSLPTYASAVIKVLKKMKCSSFSLVGHSLGGIVALLVEKEFDRSRISNLVLISSNVYSPSHIYLNTYLNRDPKKAFNYLLDHGFAPQDRDIGRKFLEKLFSKENLDILKKDITIIENLSFTSILTKTKTPMIVLSGERDQITPPEDVDILIGNLPNAIHVIVPSVGHYLPIEKPSLSIAEIANALLLSYNFKAPEII